MTPIAFHSQKHDISGGIPFRDKFGTVAKTVSSGHVRYDSCLIMITDKSIFL